MGLWIRILGFSICLFLLVSVSFSRVGAVDEEDVALDLAEAEEASDSAYVAVFDAEEAGANVSELLVKLSVGGEYLAQAYIWYRSGGFENASRFIGFCQEVIGDVGSEAVGLREEAKRLAKEDVLVRVFGSSVGVVIVFVLGFLVWGVFRRNYRKRLLRSRPEVVTHES